MKNNKFNYPPTFDSRHHKIKHLEFNRIDKYIYIGTTICCKYHFSKLISMGVKADIDLQEEKQDKPSGVESFLWLPTFDFTPPTQIQLTIGAHFIEDLVNHKMKCYVHCNAGHGRAPTLVAAYYILQGMTPFEAIKKIRKKRKLIHPNRKQLTALKLFDKAIKNLSKQ